MSSDARKACKAAESRDNESSATTEMGNSAWVTQAIRKIKAGQDVGSQFELIFRHYEPLCRHLLASLGPSQDLDDLVQEVMLRVLRGIEGFRLESSFETWLTQIVKNVARNALRHRGTKKAKATNTSLEMLMKGNHREAGATALTEPRSEEQGPLDNLLSNERTAELESMLDELPLRIRQCMLLFYFHGYKQSEIATIQKSSIHTVKKQLVEGRKKIRPMLNVFVELFSLMVLFLMMAN